MPANDKDVRIGIKTEADTKGAEQTEAASARSTNGPACSRKKVLSPRSARCTRLRKAPSTPG